MGNAVEPSDCGDGARQIRSAPDRRADILSTLSTSAEEKLAKARDRLVANGLARLLPILDLIVLNGRNRKESIRQLRTLSEAKACYDFSKKEYKSAEEALCAYAAANPDVFEGRSGNSRWGTTPSATPARTNNHP